MNTCKTCQFWAPPLPNELHGECYAVIHDRDISNAYMKIDEDTPAYIEVHASNRHFSKAVLVTTASYGCVLHTQKPADPRVRQD